MNFNEGGADCPPKVEDDKIKAAIDASTSMKGGRTAPRKLCSPQPNTGGLPHFNEGGADCPPKVPVDAPPMRTKPILQ